MTKIASPLKFSNGGTQSTGGDMSRRRPPVLIREAVATLASAGHSVDVDLTGGHYKVSWTAAGRRHLLVLSRSPSDRRASANGLATLRRLLRAEERCHD